MCKHSKKTVDKLAERQRGLDVRGNDPMATKRESSWATDIVKNPPEIVLDDTFDYLTGLPDKMNGKTIKGMAILKGALKQIKPDNAPNNPTGVQFADVFADKNKSEFKWVVDNLGEQLEQMHPDLHAKARNKPYFVDRGRAPPPRERRQSISSRHAGITTGSDRTSDTVDVYPAPLFHAKGQFRLELDSQTVKDFQKSGAPFIAGASGTMQYIALSMEDAGPVAKVKADERAKRERVLAMLSAQHVAIGHHSMAECLIAVQPYGYFKDIPDPVTDYDGAMKAFEKRLKELGFTGGMPLARENENQGKPKEQVQYEDRLSFVSSLHERYRDQFAPQSAKVIQVSMDKATDEGGRAYYDQALAALARAERDIRAEAALITAKARGNNHVLGPDELVARMGQAPKAKAKAKKSETIEYQAVKDALASYQKSMKELAGRKLDHDQAELAFEELRAALATVEKAANAYKTKHQNTSKKGDRVLVMDELIGKIAIEKSLMFQAEQKFDKHDIAELTIEQAIEYERFGVDITKHVGDTPLKESRITGKQVLGSGGINTVQLITYSPGDGLRGGEFAFKPETEKLTTHNDTLKDLGIDPNNPKFGKRNIATKKMATAAGLGDLIPDAQFTFIDGKVGLAMLKAEGEAPAKRVKTAIQNPRAMNDLKEAIAAKDNNDPDWKSKIPAKNGRGMRYGYDDRNDEFTVEALRASTIPLESPPADADDVAAVQEQMVNLQWLDALCGQTDRHAENYLIDTSTIPPTVVGIDNDFSFGKNLKDPNVKKSNSLGLPPVIDKKTFDKMKDMDWAEIAKTLSDELDQEEIQAAKDRFEAVQAQLDQLEQDGMVVGSWTDKVNGQSVTDILSGQGAFTNYYKRDAEYQKFLNNG